MKREITGEIWTLTTGKVLELTAAEVAEIRDDCAPYMNIDVTPAVPETQRTFRSQPLITQPGVLPGESQP